MNSISPLMRPRQTRPTAPPPARRFSPRRAPRGFTLIEAAMVMVIIGVGVLSMLQLLAAGSVQNNDAAEMTKAMTLANNVREASLALKFHDPDQPVTVPASYTWFSQESSIEQWDNITDLDGPVDTWDTPEDAKGWQKFSPPIDGTRKTLVGHKGWAQYVKVETIDPTRIRSVLPHDPNAELARVTVKITRDDVEVYRTNWLLGVPLTATKP